MNLFIDANIFLDFYHLSGGDIEELKKLVALVENGDIVLFSPACASFDMFSGYEDRGDQFRVLVRQLEGGYT